MIGGTIRRGAAVMLAAAGLAMSAMPDLGQQRTLSSRPGSGIVKRSGGRSPTRGRALPMETRVKRLRKNVKRHRDAIRCWFNNPCRRGAMTDHVRGYGDGK